MRFAIRYLTEYRYEEPVTDNLNVLRVTPATTATQEVDDFRVRVEPETRVHRHTDYFGTQVIEFGVTRPHDHLIIDVRARVATSSPADPPEGGWELLQAPGYTAAGGEYLMTPARPRRTAEALRELAAASREDSPADTLMRICRVIPERFAYRPGVTYVGSTVEDLLDAGAGVCQDFVHLALGVLRELGIAARYVSGYLYAPPIDDPDAASAEVQTHAWVEALLPAAAGEPRWVGADPTNRKPAGEEHVKIGHGRHYADVPPIKGVYRGSAGARMEASVRMTRVDPSGVAVARA